MAERRPNSNLAELAERLDIGYRTLHQWRERGIIPEGDLDHRECRAVRDLVAIRNFGLSLDVVREVAKVIAAAKPLYPTRFDITVNGMVIGVLLGRPKPEATIKSVMGMNRMTVIAGARP